MRPKNPWAHDRVVTGKTLEFLRFISAWQSPAVAFEPEHPTCRSRHARANPQFNDVKRPSNPRPSQPCNGHHHHPVAVRGGVPEWLRGSKDNDSIDQCWCAVRGIAGLPGLLVWAGRAQHPPWDEGMSEFVSLNEPAIRLGFFIGIFRARRGLGIRDAAPTALATALASLVRQHRHRRSQHDDRAAPFSPRAGRSCGSRREPRLGYPQPRRTAPVAGDRGLTRRSRSRHLSPACRVPRRPCSLAAAPHAPRRS